MGDASVRDLAYQLDILRARVTELERITLPSGEIIPLPPTGTVTPLPAIGSTTEAR